MSWAHEYYLVKIRRVLLTTRGFSNSILEYIRSISKMKTAEVAVTVFVTCFFSCENMTSSYLFPTLSVNLSHSGPFKDCWPLCPTWISSSVRRFFSGCRRGLQTSDMTGVGIGVLMAGNMYPLKEKFRLQKTHLETSESLILLKSIQLESCLL